MNKHEVQQKAAGELQKRLSRSWQGEFLRRNKINASQATLSRWASGKQAIPLHILVQLEIIEFKS
ncbi:MULTISPECIES: hypothetical protein [Vibrio]|uniref:Transcriptional regulator n=1 Tax=Vibrio kanaloae TaxID=170673 RepID=A0ABV4LLR5_9VIBR|nr:hypothetical protein [Vibrio kanaloae]OEF16156.1 hypothetical protein A132_05815 [Vibrio kanaloae 5S-149]